jgi:hypothetical protein
LCQIFKKNPHHRFDHIYNWGKISDFSSSSHFGGGRSPPPPLESKSRSVSADGGNEIMFWNDETKVGGAASSSHIPDMAMTDPTACSSTDSYSRRTNQRPSDPAIDPDLQMASDILSILFDDNSAAAAVRARARTNSILLDPTVLESAPRPSTQQSVYSSRPSTQQGLFQHEGSGGNSGPTSAPSGVGGPTVSVAAQTLHFVESSVLRHSSSPGASLVDVGISNTLKKSRGKTTKFSGTYKLSPLSKDQAQKQKAQKQQRAGGSPKNNRPQGKTGVGPSYLMNSKSLEIL